VGRDETETSGRKRNENEEKGGTRHPAVKNWIYVVLIGGRFKLEFCVVANG
jgi:hypothetical protein